MLKRSAQSIKIKTATATAAFLLSASTSLSLPASVFASFQQEQYYDWGISDRRIPTVLGLSVSAQEAGTASPPAQTTPEATLDLANPGTLPDSPLFFFETTFENLQSTFTFDPEAKAELKLNFAEERLAESNTLIESGNEELGTQHLENYQRLMDEATQDLKNLQEQGQDVGNLAELVEQATAKHTTVLEEVALKVPEAAKEAIQKAIQASQSGMDRAADAKGESPIPVDLLARMNALRGQGILSEEEAASLVNAPSREEARKAFKSLLDSGIVPEADFKRFDAGQAKFFPENFVKHVELSKFHELQRLEGAGAPDQQTQAKLQDFASTFKPGDIVPPDLRKYWAQTVRLEEVQKTIRPDLLSSEDFKGREQDFSRLAELQARIKPTANEARGAEEYLKANPGQPVPPEIQRILDLKGTLGIHEGNTPPPPGHYQTTYLPSTLFRFSDVPLQAGSPTASGTGTTGTSTQPNYQQFFQGPTYLPQPTHTSPEGTSSTSPTSGTGEFRHPYYPSPTSTTSPSGTTNTYTQPSGTTSTGTTNTYTQPSGTTSTGTTNTYTQPSGTTSTGTTSTYTPPSGTTTTHTEPPPSSPPPSSPPPSSPPPSSPPPSSPPPSSPPPDTYLH